MIDFRYHIYSLAAVFFALAVGIVIGTSFARRSPITQSERQTIVRYENSMRVLKHEIESASQNAMAKEDAARECEEFCRAVLPSLVKDKLAWRNVAIIRTGDYADLSGAIKQSLELAGATVTSVTDISAEFPFDDHARVEHVLKSVGVVPPDDPIKARDKLFGLITETLRSATFSEIMPRLDEAGVGSFTGDYGRFNRLVVLVGGASDERTDRSNLIDAQIVARFKDTDITVVGCEPAQAAVSYVPTWSKVGIATVDNADSAIGQFAMMYALNGEKSRFGIKETADRLIPRDLEKE